MPTRSTKLATLLALLLATPALADLWGADMGPLSTLVAQAAAQLAQLAQTLKTLRETYEETKRVAGYADDAYQAFKELEHFNAQTFAGRTAESLESAFPDLGYFRSEASHTGPWAQGTGELQRMLAYCLEGGPNGVGCVTLKEALTAKQARDAITATFGPSPPAAGAIETNAMDHEAAVGMAASAAQEGRDELARQRARALLRRCTGASGSKDARAACEAAANTATILQAEQSADIADQLAEGNRLQSARIAQENARRKRELAEAIERREVLLDASRKLAPPPGTRGPRTSDGVPFFDQGAPQ